MASSRPAAIFNCATSEANWFFFLLILPSRLPISVPTFMVSPSSLAKSPTKFVSCSLLLSSLAAFKATSNALIWPFVSSISIIFLCWFSIKGMIFSNSSVPYANWLLAICCNEPSLLPFATWSRARFCALFCNLLKCSK